MTLNSLRALYVERLRDLHDAERQVLDAFSKLSNVATDKTLRQTLDEHERETKEQMHRIEELCNELDASPRGKHCSGMEGILAELRELIVQNPEPDVLDAGLIGIIQSAEHYQIAGYGTARAFAEQLGLARHAELLGRSVTAAEGQDLRMSELAFTTVNAGAARNDRERPIAASAESLRAKAAPSPTAKDSPRPGAAPDVN